MRGIYGYIPLIIVLVAGLLVVAFIRPISRWFQLNRAISIGAVIGHITHVEGSVRRLHGGDIELIPINLEKPVELRDGDQIQTSVASKADFNLDDNGGSFEIPQGSGVLFTRWEPLKEGSAVYMRVLFGGLNNGTTIKENYVVRNGKLYFSGQSEGGAALGLTVKMAIPPPPVHILHAYPPRAMTDKIHPEMLSNEYVNAAVESKWDEFKACFQPFAKSQAKGEAEVKFQILKDGQAQDIQVAKANPADEKFQQCLATVIAGIPFRPYTGAPLALDFPLRFE